MRRRCTLHAMRTEALRLWRGHSREEAADAAGVRPHVIRQYERKPSRVRSRLARARCRRYYARLTALLAHEAAIDGMVAALCADEDGPTSARAAAAE